MNIGDFVSAKSVHDGEMKQGIVTAINEDGSFEIFVASGERYLCKGKVTIVMGLWGGTQEFVESWRRTNM